MSANAMKGKNTQEKYHIALKNLRREYASASYGLVGNGYARLGGALDSFFRHYDALIEQNERIKAQMLEDLITRREWDQARPARADRERERS